MEVWSRKEVPGRTAQMNPDGDSPSSAVQRRHFGRFGSQEGPRLPTRPVRARGRPRKCLNGSSEWITSESVRPRRRPLLLKKTEEKGARAGVPDPGNHLRIHCPSSLLPGGMETRSMKPEQVAEALEELAVDFSEEEWALLDPGQRALHTEVMKEILTHAASLSKRNALSSIGSALVNRFL
nr:zinc finger protein 669-like isoform X1 [Pogona vitticeps]XP_020633381.1 zinc finger protein 669-like isoform X1 [Pogona vitticeps]